jgi:hypothetical protein
LKTYVLPALEFIRRFLQHVHIELCFRSPEQYPLYCVTV